MNEQRIDWRFQSKTRSLIGKQRVKALLQALWSEGGSAILSGGIFDGIISCYIILHCK